MGRELGVGLLDALALEVPLLQTDSQLLNGPQHVDLNLNQLVLQNSVAHCHCLALYQLYELLRLTETLRDLLPDLFRNGLFLGLLGSPVLLWEEWVLLVLGSDQLLLRTGLFNDRGEIHLAAQLRLALGQCGLFLAPRLLLLLPHWKGSLGCALLPLLLRRLLGVQ